MPPITLPICACGCGEPLPPPVRASGRPRRYLNDAHKARAKRRRLAPSWGGEPAAQVLGTDPETRHRRALQALADYLGGKPPAPPEAQLAQLLIELTQAVFVLRSLTPRLHAQLAPRAEHLARGLDDALRQSFGELVA